MSDCLRDRIGKAICDATSAGKLFPWGTLNEREQETWRGYADAVIAELGLHTVESLDRRFIRWATAWRNNPEMGKADDE